MGLAKKKAVTGEKKPGRREGFYLYKQFMQEVWNGKVEVDYRLIDQPPAIPFDDDGVYTEKVDSVDQARYDVDIKIFASSIATVPEKEDGISITVDIDKMEVEVDNYTDAELLNIYNHAQKYRLTLAKPNMKHLRKFIDSENRKMRASVR